MAISIDYSDPTQYVINIYKADLALVSSSPSETRELNLDTFRKELNDLMDDVGGIWATTNHTHTAPVTIAGITLARVVTILSPYVVQFEDGLYNVNVFGGNSNISEKTIKNQVGVNTANSTGLQDPSDLTRTRKHMTNKLVTDPATGIATLYDDDGTTTLESSQMYEDAAGSQIYRGAGAERREPFS